MYAVGEFRTPSGLAESFLGITRNISCGGLSFESQKYDLAPGDNLEFSFKHRENNLHATSTGQIVWKINITEFDCLSGVKFRGADSSFINEMINIMSACGNVTNSSFLDKDDATPINLETIDKQLNDLPENRVSYKEIKRLGSPLIITTSILLFFVLDLYYGFFTHIVKDVESDNEQSAITQAPRSEVQPSKDGGIEKIKDETGSQNEPVKVIEKEQKNNSTNERLNRVNTGSSSVSIASRGSKEYYIQVGSWKNPEYALKVLDLVKQYYAESYMTTAGGFHKVKIPHITDRNQGDLIIKDIREKLHVAPLLVIQR